MTRTEVDIWMEQGTEDLKTSKTNLAQRIYYASVLFAQQAAEKTLKALFIHIKKESPPKTHNLVMLANMLDAPEDVVDAAADLTPEYTLTRYPDGDIGPPSQRYTKKSAVRHYNHARKVTLWVKKKMA